MTDLRTPRLVLEPLRVDHAEEMATVLDDPALHRFTGGLPDTVDELRARYVRQVAGSADERMQWLNWVVRAGPGAVGYVQVTLMRPPGGPVAELAWVIGTAYQGRGYAREGAAAVVATLPEDTLLVAHIHPDNRASAAVARALGLVPGEHVVDGETRWMSA